MEAVRFQSMQLTFVLTFKLLNVDWQYTEFICQICEKKCVDKNCKNQSVKNGVKKMCDNNYYVTKKLCGNKNL